MRADPIPGITYVWVGAIALLVVVAAVVAAVIIGQHERPQRIAFPLPPVRPDPLAGLIVRSPQEARSDLPPSRGSATPLSSEAVRAADGGVAPQAATGRAVTPEPARPVAPTPGGSA